MSRSRGPAGAPDDHLRCASDAPSRVWFEAVNGQRSRGCRAVVWSTFPAEARPFRPRGRWSHRVRPPWCCARMDRERRRVVVPELRRSAPLPGHRPRPARSRPRRATGDRSSDPSTTWRRRRRRLPSAGLAGPSGRLLHGLAVAQLMWQRHRPAWPAWCCARRRPIPRWPGFGPAVQRPAGLARLLRSPPRLPNGRWPVGQRKGRPVATRPGSAPNCCGRAALLLSAGVDRPVRLGVVDLRRRRAEGVIVTTRDRTAAPSRQGSSRPPSPDRARGSRRPHNAAVTMADPWVPTLLRSLAGARRRPSRSRPGRGRGRVESRSRWARTRTRNGVSPPEPVSLLPRPPLTSAGRPRRDQPGAGDRRRRQPCGGAPERDEAGRKAPAAAERRVPHG